MSIETEKCMNGLKGKATDTAYQRVSKRPFGNIILNSTLLCLSSHSGLADVFCHIWCGGWCLQAVTTADLAAGFSKSTFALEWTHTESESERSQGTKEDKETPFKEI